MFSINKYGRNFKPGIPLTKDFRNEVIQMAATRPVSEICERYRVNRSTVHKYTKQYRETGNIDPSNFTCLVTKLVMFAPN